MAVPGFLGRLIAWLREGYPEGVPERDYLPLFALLARRLSTDELAEVVASLDHDGRIAPGEQTEAAVRQAIEAVTKSPPSSEDVARVEGRLQAVGWRFDAAEPV